MADLTQLGRYQLLRVLGRGAMGIVYQGFDPKLKREVAVKTVLHSERDSPALKIEYAKRFIREAQAVARLSHANIVAVHDFGEEDGLLYLVMEYIIGAELQVSLEHGARMALSTAARISYELLDAIAYAHQKGVVHRDIKPANVMLTEHGQVKLTDFGVARLSDNSSEHTQLGSMVGTPSYMSPEQIAGAAVDTRSDIFSAGVVVYQLFTGTKAFQANGSWPTQLSILQQDPPLPSSLNAELNHAVDCVLMRALAKRPQDRYPTAQAFKEDLQRALAGQALADGNVQPLSAKTAPYPLPAALLELQQVSAGLASVASGEAAANASLATSETSIEREFWRNIKDQADASQYALYLERYPQGMYAALARHKLAQARGEVISEEATQILPRTPSVSSQPAEQAPSLATPATSRKIWLFGAAGILSSVIAAWALFPSSKPIASPAPLAPTAPVALPFASAAEAGASETHQAAAPIVPSKQVRKQSTVEHHAGEPAATKPAPNRRQEIARRRAEALQAQKRENLEERHRRRMEDR